MATQMNEQWTADTEARLGELGRQILGEARERQRAAPVYTRWFEGFLKGLMEDPGFRIQGLRFIDVLPALRSNADVAQHVREYFGDEGLPLPSVAHWGIRHADWALGAHLTAATVRSAMTGVARRFVGGADIKEVQRTIGKLRQEGLGFTLDLLGEATVSEQEATHYYNYYLELLEALAPAVADWKPHPVLDTVDGRPAPRLNLSVKISSLYSQSRAVATERSIEALRARLRPLLQAARERGAFICLDIEQYDSKHIVLGLFRKILLEPEFRDWPDVGIALQAYLRETEHDVVELIDWAEQRGSPVTVRLVRGAYWDYETVIARQHGWAVPVWTEKAETDLSYERCLHHLLDSHPRVEVAVATHNVRSLALAMALAEKRGLAPEQFEFQMLYGMGGPLREVVAGMGYRVRVYVPFGELIPGMAYLVRRLLENTASQSFLRLGFMEDLPAEVLLAPPQPTAAEKPGASPDVSPASVRADEPPERPQDGLRGDASAASRGLPPFANEPVRRFTDAAEREAFAAAIATVRGRAGGHYPLVIGGREEPTDRFITSVNPGRPAEVIGKVAEADAVLADAAVEAALTAFSTWGKAPVQERAGLLLRAAERLRERRDEFAAWEVLEGGKAWTEADADVCEAIDFMEYYAREALRLAEPRWMNAPGETNAYVYRPRGVGVVIPPWNFPLAILTGMLSAAIVSGNTAILKPSSQTPVVAARLMALLRDVGLPAGVVNFLPGPGRSVGEYLVRDPRVHFIAFTGSLEVGTRLYQLAAEVRPGQSHLKRVIAEMGGKNAIIIDRDADLDDAVLGTVMSAFGYQGQKCSAASRVIVVGDVHDAFVRRLVEATRSLTVGMPEEPDTLVGPVIEAAAQQRIRTAIEDGKRVANLALSVDCSHLGDGYFVGPTVFTDVPPDSPLAQEEIFGPVLAVLRAKDFEEALALANGTRYALTGGVFSRSPARLVQAQEAFEVGNLYLNRKVTAAIVGRQPFGGFRLSGVGSKAGGPDYLLQFLEPKVVTENTLRRGFAPD
jgi:RHH-type transcriptional regulator, proline utilization regulon repressor / proline dehydrogenase / delta 1-pyrroline-5-carboxylate dehydrogenase